MQDAVGSDPGLQVGQPVRAGGAEDGGHLSHREDGGDRPQPDAGGAQSLSRRPCDLCPEGITCSSAVLRVPHAPSALPPHPSRVCLSVSYICPFRDPMRLALPPSEDAGNPRFT
ncbi:hypothetical protein GCM10023335_14020 [Streptomyces siamensis]|uniref:Uncharacterized protein n=1 Tax=Streptomyces siamensis TaxID=1274986 RepID=A0ABP9IJW5_9ACTN